MRKPATNALIVLLHLVFLSANDLTSQVVQLTEDPEEIYLPEEIQIQDAIKLEDGRVLVVWGSTTEDSNSVDRTSLVYQFADKSGLIGSPQALTSIEAMPTTRLTLYRLDNHCLVLWHDRRSNRPGTYSRPIRLSNGSPGVEQQKFLTDTLEPLLERTARAGEPLYFCDATHPEYNTRPGYAWIPRGQRRLVKTVSGKRRINLNGACNAHSPCDIIVIESDRVNTDSTIELFKRLQKRHPNGTIHVVCDNASYNHSKKLQTWLKTSRIEVVPLPRASPNLNLIERLWKFMHEEVLDLHIYETLDDFRSAIRRFFKYTGDHSVKLKSLLAPNFHIEGFAN